MGVVRTTVGWMYSGGFFDVGAADRPGGSPLRRNAANLLLFFDTPFLFSS
ncbi:hypothetical protein BOO71_0011092 [Deinococcus marmoris]|uniref:Uncharacterized protein n=1 Tax=Deinococcus marmoris TaxID=249408 RepID=A0A1U7NUU7_9DEIO|nr:hypothetical protein BOO71_0011092 [Deinococcus marmoris]